MACPNGTTVLREGFIIGVHGFIFHERKAKTCHLSANAGCRRVISTLKSRCAADIVRGIQSKGQHLDLVTASVDMTISPISIFASREPATPVLMIRSTSNLSIRIWAQAAALTLPTLHLTTTTGLPSRFPSWNSMFAIMLTWSSVIASIREETSSSIAPMIPVLSNLPELASMCPVKAKVERSKTIIAAIHRVLLFMSIFLQAQVL